MVVGAVGERTEVAVIGAGPGGYVAALRAADAGFDVTLVERSALGGTCLNTGCVPSKALIEAANARHAVHHGLHRGLRAEVTVDAGALDDHRAELTTALRNGVQSLLRSAGVNVLQGDASFARYDRLSIAHDQQVRHLEFEHAILATGSRPLELRGFPWSDRVVSSTGALGLRQVPETIVIVGGGYIGIELGVAWQKLGASVTVIERAERILPELPAALTNPVERQCRDLGMHLIAGASVVEPTPVGVRIDTGDEFPASIIVVAVGRRPNSDQASIDTLDLRLSPSGHIMVDEQMRAAPGIHAIGDLVAGPALAHKASAEAERAVDAIAGRPAVVPGVVPAVIFTDPEILTVGVGIDDAPGVGAKVHRFPHVASARARTLGTTTGDTYVVADPAGTVIGVHAVGPHVSELAGEAALAVEMAATVEDLARTVHAHPTMGESIAEAGWLGYGQPLHVRR